MRLKTSHLLIVITSNLIKTVFKVKKTLVTWWNQIKRGNKTYLIWILVGNTRLFLTRFLHFHILQTFNHLNNIYNHKSNAVSGPTYKKSIDDIAEMLCDKLESLEVHSIKISPLKLLAIQMEVSLNVITNHWNGMIETKE